MGMLLHSLEAFCFTAAGIISRCHVMLPNNNIYLVQDGHYPIGLGREINYPGIIKFPIGIITFGCDSKEKISPPKTKFV